MPYAVRLERYQNHVCTIADQNRGHFRDYHIRSNEDWIVKKIIELPPYDKQLGAYTQQLCIPGNASIKTKQTMLSVIDS